MPQSDIERIWRISVQLIESVCLRVSFGVTLLQLLLPTYWIGLIRGSESLYWIAKKLQKLGKIWFVL